MLFFFCYYLHFHNLQEWLTPCIQSQTFRSLAPTNLVPTNLAPTNFKWTDNLQLSYSACTSCKRTLQYPTLSAFSKGYPPSPHLFIWRLHNLRVTGHGMKGQIRYTASTKTFTKSHEKRPVFYSSLSYCKPHLCLSFYSLSLFVWPQLFWIVNYEFMLYHLYCHFISKYRYTKRYR